MNELTGLVTVKSTGETGRVFAVIETLPPIYRVEFSNGELRDHEAAELEPANTQPATAPDPEIRRLSERIAALEAENRELRATLQRQARVWSEWEAYHAAGIGSQTFASFLRVMYTNAELSGMFYRAAAALEGE